MLQILQFSPLLQILMDRNATNWSNLARPELQKPTPHQFYISTSTSFQSLNTSSVPPLRIQPNDQKIQAFIQEPVVVMEPDEEKAFIGFDQLWGRIGLGGRRSRMRSGRRDIILEERWRMRRIRRISGWKNKRDADMEDGRGRTRSRRRKIWGLQVVFFWLYGSFNIFLFHTITTTIRYAICHMCQCQCLN